MIAQNYLIPYLRIRRRTRNVISSYPFLYLPLVSMTKSEGIIRRDTEIVIEGFPRSANSFAEAAFRLAQSRPVKIAHHCHAAAQVIAASRWGIPALVLFRAPDDAIVSLRLAALSSLSAKGDYREYNRFYNSILPYREDYILASFESVTKRFHHITKRINERFHTEFSEFNQSESMETQVFQMIDELTQIRVGKKNANYSPFLGSEYHKNRKIEKQKMLDKIRNPKLKNVRAESNDLFRKLCELADS